MENEIIEIRVEIPEKLPRYKYTKDGSINLEGGGTKAENEKKMLEIFGTNNWRTMIHYIDQVAQVAGCEDLEKSFKFLNAIIPTINAIGPKNELEAMLAVQMVGTHTLAMEMMERAAYPDQTVDNINYNINRVTKLTRTFIAQMDALSKHRGKGQQQKMTIKHVHVNEGGQAVIGNMGKGEGKNEK